MHELSLKRIEIFQKLTGPSKSKLRHACPAQNVNNKIVVLEKPVDYITTFLNQ